MNDQVTKALAAAREAVQELDGFKHPELANAYIAHCVGTLRDLLAALDAAQPVATVEQRAPYSDGSPNPHHSLRWNHSVCPSCEDNLPPGTKLYAAPPAQAVADPVPLRQPRHDLERAVNAIKATVHEAAAGLSVTEAIGALELAKLELLKEQEQ